jgi:ATP-dependent Lon protease
LKQWLDNLLAIPFGINKKPAFYENTPHEIISNASFILDNAIYGQHKTKQHILEIVARMISNTNGRGTVFAVEGAPGVGKTSLIKNGLSPIFGLPFQFISLGGTRDIAYLAGENYTYIGSKPGLLVQALKQSKCMNPIFYFDELDKVSDTPHGQEIINLLIHITDPAQNEHFQDMYLDGIPIDLSRAVFIFSFNDRALVNPILLDRMEIIKFDKYTYQDKAVIVEKYLLPEIISEYFGSSAINTLGSSNALGSSNIKVILKNKKKVLKTLILIPHNQNHRPNITPRKIGKGIIKNTRNKTRGIRCIKRKLEKAIARKNLEELIKPIKQQKQQKQQNPYTIVIKSSDLE